MAATVAALVPLADRSPSAALWVQLAAGMLCFQFAIGAANDVMDEDLDRATKPSKPIPAGLVPRSAAIGVATVFAGAGLVVTASLPLGAWTVGLLGLLCGLAYDAGLNRTRLSWLPLSIALPLIPVWVFLATDAWSAFLWWAFPLGLLLGFALHAVNQAPDVDGDARAGRRGAVHALGRSGAIRVGLTAWGAAASLTTVVLLIEEPSRAGFAAATGAIALVLVGRAARFFGRDGVFGVLASSSAVLGVVFLSAA